MEKLKPCPFCGNPQEGYNKMRPLSIRTRNLAPYGLTIDMRIYFVYCANCAARGGTAAAGYNGLTKTTTTDKEAEQEAIEKWNTRRASTGQALEREVKRK